MYLALICRGGELQNPENRPCMDIIYGLDECDSEGTR